MIQTGSLSHQSIKLIRKNPARNREIIKGDFELVWMRLLLSASSVARDR